MTSSAPAQAFPPTRWSQVLAARQESSPEGAAALEAVCRAYWYPLYAYVRRCGQSPHDAQDLTQEFFRLLLEKRWLEDADREKGRLRSFLITALKRFMANEWRPGRRVLPDAHRRATRQASPAAIPEGSNRRAPG
jgi:RNA polymerase sigma-70 factor (ECF subfamily)